MKKPLILRPGQGRVYNMGPMQAVFKADGGETESQWSVSEWWLEADTAGPGVHDHPEDHLYIVIEGCVSIFLQDTWTECEKGSYVLIPGGTPHNFENRSNARAGFINLNVPGGFEAELPGIVQWFAENPLGKANA